MDGTILKVNKVEDLTKPTPIGTGANPYGSGYAQG
jgi:hypothetical protein